MPVVATFRQSAAAAALAQRLQAQGTAAWVTGSTGHWVVEVPDTAGIPRTAPDLVPGVDYRINGSFVLGYAYWAVATTTWMLVGLPNPVVFGAVGFFATAGIVEWWWHRKVFHSKQPRHD